MAPEVKMNPGEVKSVSELYKLFRRVGSHPKEDLTLPGNYMAVQINPFFVVHWKPERLHKFVLKGKHLLVLEGFKQIIKSEITKIGHLSPEHSRPVESAVANQHGKHKKNWCFHVNSRSVVGLHSRDLSCAPKLLSSPDMLFSHGPMWGKGQLARC